MHARLTGVSLATVVTRAEQIVAHAITTGDQMTASLMAEAFSRLATYSSADLEPQQPREHAALRDTAIALVQRAHPDAWEQRERAVDAPSGIELQMPNVTGLGNALQDLDEEIEFLWGLVSSCMDES